MTTAASGTRSNMHYQSMTIPTHTHTHTIACTQTMYLYINYITIYIIHIAYTTIKCVQNMSTCVGEAASAL